MHKITATAQLIIAFGSETGIDFVFKGLPPHPTLSPRQRVERENEEASEDVRAGFPIQKSMRDIKN